MLYMFNRYPYILPQAPEIVSLYALNVSPAYIRHCVRQHFEQNRYVSDTRVVDVLIQKGRIEYQETMNCWKQLDHIMGILLQPKGRPPRTFLQKFYEGAFSKRFVGCHTCSQRSVQRKGRGRGTSCRHRYRPSKGRLGNVL